MDVSKIFSFTKILNESIKLVWKSLKFIALIAAFSSALTSILFWLVYYSIEALDRSIDASEDLLKFSAFVLAIEVAFGIAMVAVSIFTTEATILASAMSYKNNPFSLHELLAGIKRVTTRLFIYRARTTSRISSHTVPFFLSFGVLTTLLVLYPNLATISLAISFGTAAFIYVLYLAVGWSVAQVVSVIEDGFYGIKALERAAQLLEGQRLKGFLLNLFFNFLVLIIFLVHWLIFGTEGMKNVKLYGLFVLNVVSLVRMFIVVAYTVFYFDCKKNHGEETEIIEKGILYTKFPLAVDIPQV